MIFKKKKILIQILDRRRAHPNLFLISSITIILYHDKQTNMTTIDSLSCGLKSTDIKNNYIGHTGFIEGS